MKCRSLRTIENWIDRHMYVEVMNSNIVYNDCVTSNSEYNYYNDHFVTEIMTNNKQLIHLF